MPPAKTETTTEVAVKGIAIPAELEPYRDLLAIQVRDPREVISAIFGVGDLEQEDAEETSKKIAGRIIMAATLDEALDFGDVIHGQDFLDIPLNLKTVSWFTSDYEARSNCYVVMGGDRMDNGDSALVSTGSLNVLAFCWKWENAGRPEIGVKIVKTTKPTKAGYYPLRLARA